eukprot:10081953-Lingulodinium_polyedra.AAC.1
MHYNAALVVNAVYKHGLIKCAGPKLRACMHAALKSLTQLGQPALRKLDTGTGAVAPMKDTLRSAQKKTRPRWACSAAFGQA